MRCSRRDIVKGAIINGWIIQSDIYSEKNNDKITYFVNAICRECKNVRKVRVDDIQSGRSSKCVYCHGAYKKCKNRYQTFGEYTILIIEHKENKEFYKFIFDTRFKNEVMKHYWSFYKTGENVYARASDSLSSKNKNLERLHRFICELEYGREKIESMIIDHMNRNTLDTRLENLNIVTALENAQNANIRKDNTSGVKGVGWDKKQGKWCARIQYNNKRIGKMFNTFEEAVEWRKEKEKELHKYTQENFKNK